MNEFFLLKSCHHGQRMKVWVDRWAEGEGKGVYRFSSLVKQNKKGKITLSFASPEIFFFYIYDDVITSPEKEKSSANHY